MKTLPKTIYVRREVDGDISYFVAEETLRPHGDFDETKIVGEYHLAQTLEVSVAIDTKVKK